ncbi:MAG: hypothetical protein CBC13_01230 [Planctomycetia bacterium TMED53]|nr:MAG: hypothetical protein CBC13_01230 [Planctomycetia bacterium TMED53]
MKRETPNRSLCFDEKDDLGKIHTVSRTIHGSKALWQIGIGTCLARTVDWPALREVRPPEWS